MWVSQKGDRYTQRDYLDYMRTRARIRIADRKMDLARKAAVARLRAGVEAASSFEGLCAVFVERSRDLAILLGDTNFTLKEMSIPHTQKNDDRKEWTGTVHFVTEASEPSQLDRMIAEARKVRLRVDMPERPRPFRMFTDLIRSYGVESWGQTNSRGGRVTGTFRYENFPSIFVMQKMSAPVREPATW